MVKEWIERRPEPDPRTETGTFEVVRLVRQGKYGKRPHDKKKPILWMLVFHAYKQIWTVLTIVVIAIIMKACGLEVR